MEGEPDYVYEIPGMLPTLNELIDASKGNKYGGTSLKKAATDQCMWPCSALPALDAIQLRATFYRKTRNFDPDNIVVGKKFILDALEAKGVISNDGWKQIKPPFETYWKKDPGDLRTVVEIWEVD